MQQIFIHLYNCALYALFRSGSEILQKLIKRSQSIIRLTQGINWNRGHSISTYARGGGEGVSKFRTKAYKGGGGV